MAPPLGCRFHPRCPRAFEVCGWESRDLRTLLETRWTRLSEDDYEAERRVIGDLDALDEPALDCVLPAADGHFPDDAMSVFEALRSDEPEDPFFKGVAEVGTDPRGVRVRFNDAMDPRDLDLDGTRVQCHLHDREALEAARRAG